MSLNENQRDEVKDIAELKVRQYFDEYLTNVFPSQVKQMITEHDNNPTAHDGVAGEVKKAKWLLTGAAAVFGIGTGAGLRSLLAKWIG